MTDSDSDNVYEVAVPANYPKVIFCRMNPSATDNKWDNKWNQTGDLIIPTDGNDLFTISKWDGQIEGWGKYEYVKPTVSFMGSLTDWNNGSVMTEGVIYTLNIKVETAGEQKFSFFNKKRTQINLNP